jgi:hypothetical protein
MDASQTAKSAGHELLNQDRKDAERQKCKCDGYDHCGFRKARQLAWGPLYASQIKKPMRHEVRIHARAVLTPVRPHINGPTGSHLHLGAGISMRPDRSETSGIRGVISMGRTPGWNAISEIQIMCLSGGLPRVKKAQPGPQTPRLHVAPRKVGYALP